MSRRAELIAVGDEIVHGQIVDTNSGWIATELERCGVDVVRFTAVADLPDELEAAMREACARSDLVVTTGGLGPTEDDRTREAAAALVGDKLVFDEEAWRATLAWFAARQREPSPSNRRQAERPASARLLHNRWGTAPGFALRVGDCELYAFPGVPREMRGMFHEHLEPVAHAVAQGRALAFGRIQCLGPGESVLGEQLAEFMRVDRNPRVGITASAGLLSVRVAATGPNASEAERLRDRTIEQILPVVGDSFVCVGDEDLPVQVVERLAARGLTLATAESCTGGLVGELVTGVAGASAVYLGGMITYSVAAKIRDLAVPAALVQRHGEVSVEVAAAMAEGVAVRSGADIGIGISGIAGPGGGTSDKPVGHVCFGLCIDGATRSWSRNLAPLGREFVRRRSALEVLAEIVRYCDGPRGA